MLTIRLRRVGRIHKPQYRIVVAEKHKHATKKFVESLGYYNPVTKEFKINEERAKHWVGLNLDMSDTVKFLFVKHSIIK
jgi:small subunit ribosomal protein S16